MYIYIYMYIYKKKAKSMRCAIKMSGFFFNCFVLNKKKSNELLLEQAKINLLHTKKSQFHKNELTS